ncbi:MAG: ATP-binding protein [Rhodocyclaceae bacterium]|nr:ATP-binding protein [Rhodocyclaceae bacterium]
MSPAGNGRAGRLPPSPKSTAETGLDATMLADLASRLLMQRGRLQLNRAADMLRLPISVLGDVFENLRRQKMAQVAGHSGVGSEVAYELTEAGHGFAREAFGRCQYVGPAPVPLAAYQAMIGRHSIRHQRLDAATVRAAFDGIVIDPLVVDQMGAAMNSGRAILIYGPAGSGKTFLAEHLAGLLPGEVAVPHAITAGGEIIQVFDPLIHEPIEAVQTDGLIRRDVDERWQRCRRPVVIAGGELTLSMLDLQFDPSARFYQAPPHVKANGGLFVVDDLGRQMVSPRELMNRWIVPLDRDRDYLSLHTGFKFVVPFDLALIFSTNLEPQELADEAFLRRFGYKVHLGPMPAADYRRIFEEACADFGVLFDDEAFDWLLVERHAAEGRPLLACYPRDLIGRIRDFALYESCMPVVTCDALDRAWNTYFCTPASGESTAGYPRSQPST